MGIKAKIETEIEQVKPLVGRGGPGRGQGRKKKTEDHDHYTRLAKARADHEEERARLAELERMQLEGELIKSDEVQKRFEDAATRVRAKLLSVPGKVAHLVIALSDVGKADTAIKAAIHEALKELRLE